jgi:Zn-dependent oligopeptidase
MSHKNDFTNTLDYRWTEADITSGIDAVLNDTKEKLSKLVKSPKHDFKTVTCLDAILGSAQMRATRLNHAALVSTEKELRNAATQAKKKYEDFLIELYSDESLYKAVVQCKDEVNGLGKEEQRVLFKYLEDFERNGLSLTAEKREKFTALRKKISDLSLQYNSNVYEVDTKVPFTKEELTGLPDDFVNNLPKDDEGHYLVSLRYPDLYPVLELADNDETRRKMDAVNSNKCKEVNVPLLKQVLQLRQEAAELLGYDSDASFMLAIKMARDIPTTKKFLDDLSIKLDPLYQQELNKLKSLKAKAKNESVEHLNPWDVLYYQKKLLKTEYNVDDELVRQYFPLQTVVKGVLDVYQEILSLKFEHDDGARTWNADVQRYSVFDKQHPDHFLGHFYLDLFPRQGKYSHAACFPVIVAHTNDEGKRVRAASAMITNFTKPTSDKPSLLKFSEVRTFFHEFGHVMHSILSDSKYLRLNWTWSAVEQDFLEVPSMMLENWVYESAVLNRISGHYQTGKPLPDEQIQNLVRTKAANAAYGHRRLIFMSSFDLALHSPGGSALDLEATWLELRAKHVPGVPHTMGSAPWASWLHMTTGYNAGYYGYLWSEVFAKDLYAQFKARGPNGPLDTELGTKFRKDILEPCAILPGSQMLLQFLGREPNSDAFLQELGINTSK